jgi:hypothetical protein
MKNAAVFSVTALFVFFSLNILSAEVEWNHFSAGIGFLKPWDLLDAKTIQEANEMLTDLEDKQEIRVTLMAADIRDYGGDTNLLTSTAWSKLTGRNMHGLSVLAVLVMNGSEKPDILMKASIDRLIPNNDRSHLMEGFRSREPNLTNRFITFVAELKTELEKRKDLNSVQKFIHGMIRATMMGANLLALIAVIAASAFALFALGFFFWKAMRLNPLFLLPIAVIVALHILHVIPVRLAIVLYMLIPICLLAIYFGKKVD